PPPPPCPDPRLTPAAPVPYRDDDRDLSADIAQRRAVQLRAELVTVVRLARVMAHDVLSAQAMLTSERRGGKQHGFVRWWWRSQWLLTWYQRGDVAEAE